MGVVCGERDGSEDVSDLFRRWLVRHRDGGEVEVPVVLGDRARARPG